MTMTHAKKLELVKSAGPRQEVFLPAALSSIPYLGLPYSVGNLLAGPAAYFTDPVDEIDITEWDNTKRKNLIPGVGAHRGWKRKGYSRNKEVNPLAGENATKNITTETVGNLVSLLGPVAAGALIGGALKGRDGVGIGLLAGAGLGTTAQLGGLLKGTFSKKRTIEEQGEKDKETHTLKNLLIPGYSNHETMQRLRSTDY